MVSGGDLNRLRRMNELAVVGVVREAGELRLAQIAERTGLARASVGEVVRGLVAGGWLVEREPVISGRGRPAHRYGFRADAGRVLGLDIGAHNIRAVLADLSGKPLVTVRRATTPDQPRNRRLAAMDRAIAACLRAANATADQVWATVAGSTGWIDQDGRVIMSAGIPDWAGVDLADHLKALLPGSIAVDNDTRLAALAEQRIGAGQGVQDLVLLQAGRRTGIGLVVGGRVHRGFGSAAGDFTMMRTLKWESAIEYLLLNNDAPAGPSGDPVTDTLRAAAEGHPAAVTATRRYVRELAIAAAAVVSVLDPEVVVLGGSMSEHADLLLPMLTEELTLLCLRVPEIRASQVGADAAALGAVQLAVGHLEEVLFAEDGAGPLGTFQQPALAR
jgi:predicted NBD/HSP70 family sugar kinase